MRYKMIAAGTGLVLCLALSACGSLDVSTSTVKLEKNGKITECSIESFDESRYDAEELKQFVADSVSEYLAAHADAGVKAKDPVVEEGQASLWMNYDSVDTFAEFKKVSCFAGTISEARAAGYSFDGIFTDAAAQDQESADSSVDEIAAVVPGQTFLKDESLKVFILDDDVDVIVPGEIAYVSTVGTTIVDKHTVAVDRSGQTEKSPVYVLYY